MSGRSGQVAVILIVVIAIGLIFLAASINLTMMSQFKTLTMKAAAASASSTASFIASYGQKEYVETMGWRVKYCKSFGGGLMGILTIIVMIVIAIFAPEILGAMQGVAASAASGVGALQAAAVVGAVMEAASMVIAASIDPGISAAWNKMQNANLSITGQVVERGVQTALQAAVTDQVRIPDIYDMDGDGLFGYPPLSASSPTVPGDAPKDTIGRFSYYNTKRYLGLPARTNTAVQDFLDALHELVVSGADSWGLWDPVYYPDYQHVAPGVSSLHPCLSGVSSPTRPAECDHCCDIFDPSGVPVVPDECTGAGGTPMTGNYTTCAARSPFQSSGNLYPYIYDFSYEDSTNTFMSFREQLGRDDEHDLYNVTATNPNWHSQPLAGQQTLIAPAASPRLPGKFYLKDVVGYYQNPPFVAVMPFPVPVPPPIVVPTPDEWINRGAPPLSPKLFPFLYKMTDWGVHLADAGFNYNDSGDKYHCHWCASAAGNTCNADYPGSYPEIPRLVLSGSSAIGQGLCVNNVNRSGATASDPPWVADLVDDIAGLEVANTACGVPSPTNSWDLSLYHGGWKRGADRYCSNTPGVLYSLDCPKHGAVGPDDENPECGEAGAGGANLWPDDMLDDIVYGLPALYDLERNFQKIRTASPGGLASLVTTMPDWYGFPTAGEATVDGIADWIEPPCPNPGSCPGSFTKLERPGTLWVWREELRWLNNLIQTWLLTSFTSPSLMGSNAAWCVPSFAAGNGSAPAGEVATFDANGDGTRGQIGDVMACLDWNANDARTYTTIPLSNPDHTATGNLQKFQRCQLYCSADTCMDLPRSMLPDFYNGALYASGKPANVFDPGNAADVAAFSNCLGPVTVGTTSAITHCATNCNALPSGYGLPGFNAPTLTSVAAIDTFCGANPTGTGSFCNPSSGLTLNCANPTSKANCRCSWAGSCAGFIGGCTLDNTYSNAVNTALVRATGSCADSAYLTIMQKSADEAKLQVEKFRKRLDFLTRRYDEAMALSNDYARVGMDLTKPEGILTVAINKLTKFLDNDTPSVFTDSPAEKFIQARIALDSYSEDTGDLPAFGLYVWQDQDDKKFNPGGGLRGGSAEGYWHAVKVDVRIPRRCAGDCIATEWPKVFSKTKKPGILKKGKICYELRNLIGMTKARVTRYDEDKDLRGLLFPGGARIWESRLSHPLTGQSNPASIRTICADLIDADLKNWLGEGSGDRRYLGAAFMMNKVPAASPSTAAEIAYKDCWRKVHQDLLAHGIESEACAEYYFVHGARRSPDGGFRVRFVPCDNW